MGKNLWSSEYVGSRHMFGGLLTLNLIDLKIWKGIIPYSIRYLPPFVTKAKNSLIYDEAGTYNHIDIWCEHNCSGSFLIAESKASFENPEDLALFILRWM